jgi:hypothetical protein
MKLLYGTQEDKIKTLKKKGNIITFKEPFRWKGDTFTQILISGFIKDRQGNVKIEASNRDSNWYPNINAMVEAVNWEYMEKAHGNYYNIKSQIDEMQHFKFKEKETIYVINNIEPVEDGRVFFADMNNRKEINDLPIYSFMKKLSNKEIVPLKNISISKTKEDGQIHKTASEKLEGVMKSLGLKEVWDQLSKDFQTWANGAEAGRKSFTIENKTFRRTGFADAEKNISTDMIADIALNFNKNEKGVFFNSYTVDLKNSIINGIKPEKRGSIKDTFVISLKKDESANNLTVKKALNLLDGRSVNIGEYSWIKRNGSDVVEYKFDLEKAIKENQHIDFSDTKVEHMESALESLKKGDFALIGCAIDNTPVHIFLTADAQYKKVEAHDNTLYRHLSEAEQAQIKENMNHKQDQVQGAKQHY